MPEELASTRATGGKNNDQDQDPRHWGCNQLLPRVETDSPHPTELRWNLPTTSKERCFPYPDLDRIKTLKHVYTDILSLPGSLHGTLTSVGGVNQSVLTPYIWGPWVVSPLRSRLARRPTRRAGTDTSSTTTEGSLQTARPSLTQGRAPAHCPQPGAQRRMRRGAAGGGGAPMRRSPICACAGRAEAQTGYLGRCCPGAPASPGAQPRPPRPRRPRRLC
ncbi:transmembrane protein 250 isoform X1 [Bos javanicus]|uniref:transmembrane protein 250 isoform X1 n=1 Tax=Bos javanicus TaxID=9906 RepID=UPI002AA89D12|nr:transmembrane protein 250 isoform X1 [Bos javanicus]